MSDRSVILALRTTSVAGAALAVGGTVMGIALAGIERWLIDDGALFVLPFVTFFSVFVWLVIQQQPRNRVVWTMASSAFFGGVFLAALAAAAAIVEDPDLVLGAGGINRLIAAELSSSAAWSLVIAAAAFSLAIYSWTMFGLLLFPDGRLPSPRWRWVARYAGVSALAFTVGFAWTLRPSSTQMTDETAVAWVLFPMVLVAQILSLAALVTRFRRSRGATRQQFKWIVWGAAVFVPALVLVSMLEGTPYQSDLLWVPLLLAEGAFLVSYGIAVAKYRLVDIDVVISRTVAYGALAALITAVYALIVVGLGTILGQGAEPNLVLSITAIAVIAIAFEPARSRLERWANRLVYGKRATPHEVLSQVTARLSSSESSDDRLTELANLVGQGTGAEEAVVWLAVGHQLRPEAAVPAAALEPVRTVDVSGLPQSEVASSVEVRHGDELLGALTITKSRREPPTPADEQLLADVAAGAGLMLRNIRLNSELEERAAQVRASRRRLIAAHDTERHRLERDLHDGAQQEVVALKVKLGLAKAIATQEGADDLAADISALAEDTQKAVDQMRAVAHGIYPPLLEAEGLKAALGAAGRSVAIPVELEAGELGRYAKQIEETAYFGVTELISEAAMAGATSAAVNIESDLESLSIAVSYDATRQRLDRTTLADRVDAAEGSIEEMGSAADTRVTVRLPARVLDPA